MKSSPAPTRFLSISKISDLILLFFCVSLGERRERLKQSDKKKCRPKRRWLRAERDREARHSLKKQSAHLSTKLCKSEQGIYARSRKNKGDVEEKRSAREQLNFCTNQS